MEIHQAQRIYHIVHSANLARNNAPSKHSITDADWFLREIHSLRVRQLKPRLCE